MKTNYICLERDKKYEIEISLDETIFTKLNNIKNLEGRTISEVVEHIFLEVLLYNNSPECFWSPLCYFLGDVYSENNLSGKNVKITLSLGDFIYDEIMSYVNCDNSVFKNESDFILLILSEVLINNRFPNIIKFKKLNNIKNLVGKTISEVVENIFSNIIKLKNKK